MTRMKKTIIALVCFCAVMMFGSMAMASADTYAVTGVDIYLALRTAPSFDYANEIGKLYEGETVEVQSYDGQYWWVYSSKYGRSGYVNSDYLRYVGGGSSSRSSYSGGTTYTVSVSEGYLALRTGKAFLRENEIGELYTGDTVQVQDTSDSTYWWVYSPKHGRSGYVNKNYLVGGGRTDGTAYTVKVDSGYLALRTAMAYDAANEIGELYTGDTVYVQERTSNQYWWVYSPKHGRYGYVNKDYLR